MCGGGGTKEFINKVDPLGARILGLEQQKDPTVIINQGGGDEPQSGAGVVAAGVTGEKPPKRRRGISLLGSRAGSGDLAQTSRPLAT